MTYLLVPWRTAWPDVTPAWATFATERKREIEREVCFELSRNYYHRDESVYNEYRTPERPRELARQ